MTSEACRTSAVLGTAIVGGLVLAAWAAVPAQSQSQSEDKVAGMWVIKAPMPAVRNEVAAAALGGRLYVFGGNVGGGAADLARTEEYDPATDTWRVRAPLPSGANHMSAAALNGRIYVIGGFAKARHNDPTDSAFEYDPAQDTWRALAPISSPRGSVGLAAVDGKIHAIGGRGPDFKPLPVHQVLDPATGQWSDAAPMPGKAHDHTATIAVDGKIHVIGGRFGEPTETTDTHLVYEPATNSWSSAPALPAARSSLTTAFYKGLILVIGGETDTKSLDDNEGFDVQAGRWVKLAPLPSLRHGIAGAAIGDLAYFAGGAQGNGGNGTSDQLFAFSLP